MVECMSVRVCVQSVTEASAKVSRNRRNDKIPWVRKVSGNRRNDNILWKVIISRDFFVLLFPDTFEYGKCLKIGEVFENSLFQGFLLFYCFWTKFLHNPSPINTDFWSTIHVDVVQNVAFLIHAMFRIFPPLLVGPTWNQNIVRQSRHQISDRPPH